MTYRLRRGRGSILAASAALAALVLAGCSAPAPADGGDGLDEVVQLTVATLPTANLASIHLGIQEGFFEEENLEITIQTVQTGSEMITGAVGGAFPFFAPGYVPIFTAIGQGLPLKLIAGNDTTGQTVDDDWWLIMAGAGSDVETPEDLVGATIGVNALKGVSEVVIRASLAERGIDDSQIELTEIPFPEMPAALASGIIDAAQVPEPFVSAILADGGHIVDAPGPALAPGFPNGAWATTDEMIQTQPEVVAAFTRAIERSVEFAAENPDAVRAIIPEYTQVSAEVAESMRLPLFDPELKVDLLHQLLEYCVEYGVVEEIPADDALFYRP